MRRVHPQEAPVQPTFAFRGPTRTIARAVVETMVPRWPDFDEDLTEPVLDRLEKTVGAQPRAVQALVVAGLWGLEISGPVFGHGLGRLSRVDRDERDRRLTRIAQHPFPTFRQGILLYQTLVNLCAYSMPEVEAHLGARRRDWRQDRQALREVLVQLDESAGAPPPPTALGTQGHLSADRFLEFGAAERLRASIVESASGAGIEAGGESPAASGAPAGDGGEASSPKPAKKPRRRTTPPKGKDA